VSEIELDAHLRALAGRNKAATSLVSFAGAGCYDHYTPSIVDHILRKPEFFTAYTPYQPEVSQGTLQAIFEYQSMICSLTGMDVANASMYDGATAMVEAALMACRATKRDRVVCSALVHPEWRATLRTYSEAGTMSVTTLAADSERGTTATALGALGDDVAAVIVASPNIVGSLEDVSALSRAAKEAGALLIVATNPIMLGVMEPPGSFGADIVVGEGQPLGNAMSFGGPGLGFFACLTEHIRQMPGRLVGRTVDLDGNDAFVLTLATREQHIRREKATSNICSNHALNALAAGAYLSAVGPDGLAGIARVAMARARHLREKLLETGRFRALWNAPFGYEFALAYDGDAEAMQSALAADGYLAGVRLSAVEAGCPTDLLPHAADEIVLFAVTERRTAAEIDAFVEAVVRL
jgi:glycine dehydrogenase subunit 1